MPSFPEVMQYVPGLIGAPFRAWEGRQAREAQQKQTVEGIRRLLPTLDPKQRQYVENQLGMGHLDAAVAHIEKLTPEHGLSLAQAAEAVRGTQATTAGTQATTANTQARLPGIQAGSEVAALEAANAPGRIDMENQAMRLQNEGTQATTANAQARLPGIQAGSEVAGLEAANAPNRIDLENQRAMAEIEAMNVKVDEDVSLSPLDAAEQKREIAQYGDFVANKPQLDDQIDRYEMVLSALEDGSLTTGQVQGRAAFPSPIRDLLHSVSIEIARAKLKDAGESRPTDRDVDLMIESGPNLLATENFNMRELRALLKRLRSQYDEADRIRRRYGSGAGAPAPSGSSSQPNWVYNP